MTGEGRHYVPQDAKQVIDSRPPFVLLAAASSATFDRE